MHETYMVWKIQIQHNPMKSKAKVVLTLCDNQSTSICHKMIEEYRYKGIKIEA
jgi:hypothetical protein